MKPLVSAIVTSYNHSNYLEQRLDSLASQTYDNIEIIVVDDNSTDDSVRVLKELNKRINFKLLLLEDNVGYAQACNIGISASQGEYIIFAESDDYSNYNQIEKLQHGFEGHNVGVVFSASNMVDSLGEKFGEDISSREGRFQKMCSSDTEITSELMKVFFLHACVIPNMSAAMIKRKHIDVVCGFDTKYKLSADWNFWCMLSMNSNFYYIREPLNNFRQHMHNVRTLVLNKESGVFLQMSEIMNLLNRHANNICCKTIEKVYMNVVIGRYWFNIFISNPGAWYRDYRLISSDFSQYTKLWPIYFFSGVLSKVYISAFARIKTLLARFF